MEVIRRAQSLKEICRQARARGRRVGLVPTMGALHEGHLSLMRRTHELTDILVVSIFVNPTQFSPTEDLARYPRDLPGDVDMCIAEKVDYVFAPEENELYPSGSQTIVDVTEIAREFEETSRPGHFRGVATVVLKLLQIVQPTVAAFGQKDIQQAMVVRRMARDLMLDGEILVLPIVRDADGLALSSRNRFLSPDERKSALAIPRALAAAQESVSDGERRAERVVNTVRQALEAEERIQVDYVDLVDAERFERIGQMKDQMYLIVAATVGNTRLLDNVTLHV